MDIEINIYTDGSCSGNPGPGGWAAVILNQNNETIISGFESNTTNNRMEILAAIKALQQIKHNTTINLFTDSNYLKNGITSWIHNWKKNNWINSQKKSVANQDLWRELDELNNELIVNWNWVKAHENNFYNNLADQHAVSAMKYQKNLKLENGKIL